MLVHVRYEGTSRTLEGEGLGLRPDSSESAVREALAAVYHLPPAAFRHLVVDRHPDGLVVRPPAVFG